MSYWDLLKEDLRKLQEETISQASVDKLKEIINFSNDMKSLTEMPAWERMKKEYFEAQKEQDLDFLTNPNNSVTKNTEEFIRAQVSYNIINNFLININAAIALGVKAQEQLKNTDKGGK
jgi:hypothetical protein